MKTKVVCLIQMNQFEEAIKFISSTPEIQEHAVFEKAYCYYREQKMSAALETITEADPNDLNEKERMTNFIAVNASLSMFENTETNLNCEG